MTAAAPNLRLPHYFLVEGVNAVAATLFLYCAFFWTKARFGFTDTHNLLLTATHGLVYILLTRWGGKLSDRLGYDRMLSACLLGMTVTLLAGWLPRWWLTPFLLVALYTVFIAPTWPALEAAILHCPGTTSMPNRLGLYNVTWALGDGLGFALSGVLFAWREDSIVWVAGLFHLSQLVWMKLAPRHHGDPGQTAMKLAHHGDAVARPLKRRFMHTAWLANGLAFMMLAGFSALTPFVGERLRLGPSHTIWLASTLLFARTVAFVVFWKWEGWHYHRGWLRAAMWLSPVALGIAFYAVQPVIVFGALVVLGVAIGLSYSASLYYSLDYGENKGEIGGQHESILGIGILVGPLLAALVSGLGGGTIGAEWTIVLLGVAATGIGRHLIDRSLKSNS